MPAAATVVGQPVRDLVWPGSTRDQRHLAVALPPAQGCRQHQLVLRSRGHAGHAEGTTTALHGEQQWHAECSAGRSPRPQTGIHHRPGALLFGSLQTRRASTKLLRWTQAGSGGSGRESAAVTTRPLDTRADLVNAATKSSTRLKSDPVASAAPAPVAGRLPPPGRHLAQERPRWMASKEFTPAAGRPAAAGFAANTRLREGSTSWISSLSNDQPAGSTREC